MIEHLRGRILSVHEDHLVLDVNGVGYGLFVPHSTKDRAGGPGAEAAFHTTLVVREDALTLYGFQAIEEKMAFDVLISVSGIGPRTALDMLSTLPINDFVQAVRTGNVNTLIRIPGVGRKRAERLIVELKDRLAKFPVGRSHDPAMSESEGVSAENERPPVAPGEPDVFQDAVAALEALGIKSANAQRSVAAAMRAAENPDALTVEQIVRDVLRQSQGSR